jgi:hypothetical protein
MGHDGNPYLSCNCPKDNRLDIDICYEETSHVGIAFPKKKMNKVTCAVENYRDIPEDSPNAWYKMQEQGIFMRFL